MNPRTALRTTPRVRLALAALLALLLLCAPAAWAQGYTSIVVLGDSLSDTGNDAALSNAKYGAAAQVPGPLTGYTNGRFTDGSDTVPYTHSYYGVWVEQLAQLLNPTIGAKPIPTVNSLAGGTNYAYGYATTNTGTSQLPYGPSNAFSITVNNMGQQLSDYLATKPTISPYTLFIVWGGANDVLGATSSADVVAAATREAGIVQTLVAAGATNILVPNLPPLGLIPRFNSNSAKAAQATAAAQAFNQTLAAALTQVQQGAANKTTRVLQLDVYTLFNTVVAGPASFGFTNVTASSQGNATVNPDTYLFWDDLHPTTYGHSLIAANALRLLGTPLPTGFQYFGGQSVLNLGQTYTAQAQLLSPSANPIGLVTLTSGTTVLGTAYAIPDPKSPTTSTASFNIPGLPAGMYNVVANYTGVNGFTSATSPVSPLTVVVPSYTTTLSPATLAVNLGQASSLVASVTGNNGVPVGTVTFSDGSTVVGTAPTSEVGSTLVASASFSTASLAAGTHTITASFTGTNGYSSSASAASVVTVTAPSYTAALSPTTISIPRGNSGSSTLTVTPMGGFTGSLTVACGSVTGLQCSIANSSLTTTGAAVTTTVTINTANVAALHKPALPFLPATPQVADAVLGLSLLSGLGLARRRARTLRAAALWMLPVLLSLAVLLGVSGCAGGGGSHNSAAGTYTVPVTITPSSGTAQTVTLTVNVV